MSNSELNSENMVWMDLEMTGLDPDVNQILEIATIITDKNLNELALGPAFVIHTPLGVLQAMDEWNTRHHSDSGLWQRALESSTTIEHAQAETLSFIKAWVPERKSPLCGNSIGQDRRFLVRGMPQLEAYLHYRNVDVSTLKELAKRWAPAIAAGHIKRNEHLALADVRESIDELRYYRRFMGELAGIG
jgi:oligoribonuclease